MTEQECLINRLKELGNYLFKEMQFARSKTAFEAIDKINEQAAIISKIKICSISLTLSPAGLTEQECKQLIDEINKECKPND